MIECLPALARLRAPLGRAITSKPNSVLCHHLHYHVSRVIKVRNLFVLAVVLVQLRFPGRLSFSKLVVCYLCRKKSPASSASLPDGHTSCENTHMRVYTTYWHHHTEFAYTSFMCTTHGFSCNVFGWDIFNTHLALYSKSRLALYSKSR